MPLTTKQIKNKWRVVEMSGRIAKNASGTALDGGGHETEGKAKSQAQAVNISQHKKQNALA